MINKIVKVYKDHCANCMMMDIVLQSLVGEVEGLELTPVNITSEYGEKLMATYEIQALPTLLFFEDDTFCSSLSGIAEKKDILDIIRRSED